MRTVFATAPLAYGTDARDSVISTELVFIGHANILTVEVLCEGLHTYRTWLSRQGLWDTFEMFSPEAFRMRTENYYNQMRLMNYVFYLLDQGSIQRLRTCPECEKWFYAMTDRQLYCKPACGQRSASHDPDFKQRRKEYMRAYRRRERRKDEDSKKNLKKIYGAAREVSKKSHH